MNKNLVPPTMSNAILVNEYICIMIDASKIMINKHALHRVFSPSELFPWDVMLPNLSSLSGRQVTTQCAAIEIYQAR